MSAHKPLIIIPARVGSTRVKRKNFRQLPHGYCLVDLAIRDARKLGGTIVLTTDHPNFAARGVTVIRRDQKLALSLIHI